MSARAKRTGYSRETETEEHAWTASHASVRHVGRERSERPDSDLNAGPWLRKPRVTTFRDTVVKQPYPGSAPELLLAFDRDGLLEGPRVYKLLRAWLW